MSGVVARIGTKVGTKLLTWLNIAFAGHEVGDWMEKKPAPANFTTTIIQRIPQEDNTTHMWIIIGFILSVLTLGFILLAAKVIMDNRKISSRRMIEAIRLEKMDAVEIPTGL